MKKKEKRRTKHYGTVELSISGVGRPCVISEQSPQVLIVRDSCQL